jgi:hypothetical protein
LINANENWFAIGASTEGNGAQSFFKEYKIEVVLLALESQMTANLYFVVFL